jgi:hypothetical protein
MRGPASVADPVSSGYRIYADHLFQIAQLARSAADAERPIGAVNGEAGRIIAAILEAFQAFENDGDGVVMADVTYNSAHRAIMNGAGMAFGNGRPTGWSFGLGTCGFKPRFSRRSTRASLARCRTAWLSLDSPVQQAIPGPNRETFSGDAFPPDLEKHLLKPRVPGRGGLTHSTFMSHAHARWLNRTTRYDP